VEESIVWRVLHRQIDWFVLKEREYALMPFGESGLYRSELFRGLWLDPAMLVRNDTRSVCAALQQGLACPAHAAFVASLNA
jgi:hypothetical protein